MLIGSDFVWKERLTTCYCSECDRRILKGEKALHSIRNGKVMKVVCSEECRLTFDDRFWREAARVNVKRRKGIEC